MSLNGQVLLVKDMCNYVSSIRFLYNLLDLAWEVLDSFPVQCLLRASDLGLTMRTHPPFPLIIC